MRRRAKPAKAKVEAKRPVARKSPKRDGATLRDLEKRLAEALARETATSEILRVISQPSTEVKPVFEAIVRSGAALCHAPDVIILIADSGSLRVAASVGPVAASVRQSQLFQGEGLPLTRGSVSGRAFIDRRTVHVRDVSALPDDEFPEGKMLQREYGGHGTTLAVPLLREDVSLGVITLLRNEISPFTDRQVAFLKTFADQAVIAIENVRLFNETKEALDQQTATSEILRIISTSPTDLRPVLEAVVESAVRFCGAHDAVLFRLDGQVLRRIAHHGPIPSPINLIIPVVRGTVSGRSALERRAVHVADLQAEGEEFPEGSAQARELGFRAVLVVPLLSEGTVIGTIGLRRTEANPFTDRQVALLETFGDQAVIAIENVRLFTELQEKNRALTEAHAQVTEALEQQTATAEVLNAISRAQTDAQPVFDIIAASALRLCGADYSQVQLYDGELIHLAAQQNVNPEGAEAIRRVYPLRVVEGTLGGRAIRTRAVVQIHDLLEDRAYECRQITPLNMACMGWG